MKISSEKIPLIKVFFFLSAVILALLLYKDVFSERTLIPNLEPYPDTIHYIDPALSFISGKGLILEREGRIMAAHVPPLYSLILIPVYSINNDVRLFYFANVFLSFISLTLFFLVLKKITKNIFLIGLTLFIYVTNYYIYWVPNLAMAENLILPLFLGSLLLIKQEKITNKKIILAGGMAVGFYATKYAAITLGVALISAYLVKILTASSNLRLQKIALLFFSAAGFFLLLVLFQYFLMEINMFSYINNIFNPPSPEPGVSTRSDLIRFSFIFFIPNFSTYVNALLGFPMDFLWNQKSIIPKMVGILGLAGTFGGLFIAKLRNFSIYTSASLLLALFFLSTFYSTDARYIYYAIPILLLGFAGTIDWLFTRMTNFKKIIYLIIGIFFVTYLLSSGLRLKNQVALNLKHSETPWYYVAVKVMNKYFDGYTSERKDKPYLISAQPPYYIDYFSNNNFRLLPLSKDQEFRLNRKEAWGENNYSNLLKLYESFLLQGKEVFLAQYGLGDVQHLHEAFGLVKDNFKVTLVQEGCFNVCNIYKLELKKHE